MNSRASLAVPAMGASAKALEDARRTQAAIEQQCTRSGEAVPPYVLNELIGKGSFGRVYKATDTRTQTSDQKTQAVQAPVVSVKIINIEEGDIGGPGGAVDTFADILKEVKTLKLLSDGGARNVNVVLDSLLVGQSVWIVTEYCAGGSVATLMKPTGFLVEKWIVPILREAAEALFWVHQQGIIHRDVKCANVLVSEAGGVQLCDFGVAGVVASQADKRRTVTGTLHWMAPELFAADVAYGSEVDIWAFGAMAYEMASGLPPNARMPIADPGDFGAYLAQHSPRLVGEQYSVALKDLVAFCLIPDPAKRPTIEQIQRHAYLDGTASTYPTESLGTLLAAYRLWQQRGGGRLSLFSAGGAQGGIGGGGGGGAGGNGITFGSSYAQHIPDWDFFDSDASGGDDDGDGDGDDDDGFSSSFSDDGSDTAWSTFPLDGSADAKAVYEAYGVLTGQPLSSSGMGLGRNADNDASSGSDSAASPSAARQDRRRGRRRPPANMPRIQVPLEKMFNPNTLTNYHDNARAMYRQHAVPWQESSGGKGSSRADLPLREDRTYAVRESLIDLDASLLSLAPDEMDDEAEATLRPQAEHVRRRTQDWTFPSTTVAEREYDDDTAAGSNNSDTDVDAYTTPVFSADWSFPEPSFSVPTIQLPGVTPAAFLGLPPDAATARRQSTASLIDLDAGLVGGIINRDSFFPPNLDYPDATPDPSSGMAAFGLGLNGMTTPLPRPSSSFRHLGREPSIYVPDGIGIPAEAALAAEAAEAADHYAESEVLKQSHSPFAVPMPPSTRAMEGTASRGELRDELVRLLETFSAHLQVTTNAISDLPVHTRRRSSVRKSSADEHGRRSGRMPSVDEGQY